ncbi:MAG: TatD family hydrolase [Muribaculaceae bacterium]|nr:TatD family hydrolase [Muribaculaceae bacterium]
MLDCHTHKTAPYPEGIISTSPDTPLMPSQAYSLGVHPWYIPADPSLILITLEQAARNPQVAAIGETGLDSRCATPMWLQIKCFSRHIEISELLNKPLIIHCVRTGSEIAQMRRAKGATMPWIIHGFRGKPSVLEILLDAGCYISYGEHFNVESLALTPEERLLAETDESALDIHQIIDRLSTSRSQDLSPIIQQNMSKLFSNL